MDIYDKLLKKRIVILDGATGTNLFDKGLIPGEPPASLNLKNQDAVYELQKKYIYAGSDIILTNTFSANPINFKEDYRKIIKAGVKIALKAAGDKKFVLGDVGPLGILIKPYGDGDFEEVYNIYCQIFKTFYKSGINSFLLETFNSIIEAKAAFLAAKEYSDNIGVSFTFQNNCRTIFGELPESIAITFDRLGTKTIGVNCTEPDTAIEVLKRMSLVTNLPLLAKPNAGKVWIEDNKLKNSISDKKLAGYFEKFVKAGARLIGGCCGTSPQYIKLISEHRNVVAPFMVSKDATGIRYIRQKNVFYLTSPQKYITIDKNSTIIVGERLNPSGRKKLKQSLLTSDYTIYGSEAKSQEDAGVDAIDINAFIPELDESKTLLNCLYEVIKNCNLPVFIDTQNFSAAEKSMRIYPGIGVYNSIPAREKELKRYLPLVKKFGFKVVISLVGKKIPRTFNERMKNVRLTIKVAKRLKFPVEDLIFDPLVFSAASEPEQISESLKTVAELSQKGLKTVLGISNVSFGLPERSYLNAVLVTLAINSGVNFLIINPLDQKVMEAYWSSRALLKKEVNDYIKWVKDFLQRAVINRSESIANKPIKRQLGSATEVATPDSRLIKGIVEGDVKSAVDEVKRMLDSGVSSQKIIDHYIFNGMKIVGERYEKGIFFIPDLMKSAEATRAVMELIKKRIKHSPGVLGECGKKKRIVLATVKGDIHDIGKNIVAMVLESAGYEVIDLGKDVDTLKIVEAVKKYKPIAVGLSALLTTTMPEMGNVIKLLRKNGFDTPVLIGGPNVSEGFAKQIGAYAAVNNAFEGLRVLKEIG